MKKIISIVLSLMMLLGVLSGLNFTAYAMANSGSCGKNVTYKFDKETGTLTISGSGNMKNYSEVDHGDDDGWYPDTPFYNNSDIKKVVVKSGVTSIGNMAFINCRGLTSVTLPASVKKIGESAFEDCNKLARIKLPSKLTSLGAAAFENCKKIKSVKIPGSVKIVHSFAFYNCTALSEVTVSKGVKQIRSYAFKYCKSIKSISLPESVTVIDDCAFNGCKNLADIKIGSKITKIGHAVFRNTAYSGTKSHWKKKVLYIDKYLVAVNPAIKGTCNIKTGTKLISSGAFYYCTKLSAVSFPKSVKTVGYCAFDGCTGLKKVMICNLKAWCNTDFDFAFANPLYYAHKLYLNGKLVTDLKIPKKVKTIKDCAFVGGSFKSVKLPAGLKTIGNYAFRECSNLKTVKAGKNITKVGDEILNDTPYFRNSKHWSGKVLYLEKYAIASREKISGKVTIKSGTKAIAAFTFYNRPKLKSVFIPKSVVNIGYYALGYDKKLTSVSVSKDNKNYSSKNGVLFNKKKTTLLYYPEGRTNTSYTIPKTVTKLDEGSFENCTKLEKLTMPKSVKTFELKAFGDDSSIKKIIYKGTKSDWKKIKIKHHNNYDSDVVYDGNSALEYIEIVCTNGVI